MHTLFPYLATMRRHNHLMPTIEYALGSSLLLLPRARGPRRGSSSGAGMDWGAHLVEEGDVGPREL